MSERKRDGYFMKYEEMHGENNVWITDGERAKGSMLMLGFSESMDQLAMADGVGWNGRVMNRVDGYVL